MVNWGGLAKFAVQHRRGVRPRTEIIPYELDAVGTAERTCICACLLWPEPYLLAHNVFNALRLMKVEINHKEIEAPDDCRTLSALLKAEGFDGAGRAVAVNNRVVPKSQWDSFMLEDGMKITVIRAVCGG